MTETAFFSGGKQRMRAWLGPALPGAVLFLLLALAEWPRAQEPVPPTYGDDCTRSGCHDQYTARSTSHRPVDNVECDACHEPKAGPGHRFSLVEEEPALCHQCHEGLTEKLELVHGPVAAGFCTACHDPHGSNHSGMLLSESVAVCGECHSALGSGAATRASRHMPATQDCTFCHQAHGGGIPYFLTSAPPELCLDCHDQIGEILEGAPVKHGATTTGRACLGCHDPHAADRSSLLRQDTMELCLTCHGEEIVAEGRRVAGLGQKLIADSNHHGPIRQRECTICHSEIHGGQHFRLLMGDYPAEFYSPFDEKVYGLCFECHEAELAKEETTESATGFRNGNRNLHFLHVNRDSKGRSCRACHDVHASPNPKLIAVAVPFGPSGWRLPLNFQATERGGSCAPGCHKPYRYDRLEPVVNLPVGGGG